LMALKAEASGSAQRVLRFAFLTAKLSIDTGELTDKGAISQRNILKRHAALIEKLYADSPTDNVICLDRVSEEAGWHLGASLRGARGTAARW
jgi:feruloyl-CoA synthase